MPVHERIDYRDPETGLRVTRWTAHPSNHLYFTNPGWFDENRQLAIASDRCGRTDLAALDLATGDLRPVTTCAPGEHLAPYHITVDAVRNLAYTWISGRMERVDLMGGGRSVLYVTPGGWQGGMLNVTCDGAQVAFGMIQAMGDLDFGARFADRPTSRIMVLDLATGRAETVHERDCWMGHVNTSPADPQVLSFCHEGPWTKVEHRVWALNLGTGQAWKVGPNLAPPACVGHEYWLADGRRIAYHGYNTVPEPVLGIVDVHSGERREAHQPVKTKHSHSLDGDVIVGDGSEARPYVLAWRFRGETLEGPRPLCRHGGGWSEQRRHVHPRIAPDGRSVVFTSDASGHPQVYSVEVPETMRGGG